MGEAIIGANILQGAAVPAEGGAHSGTQEGGGGPSGTAAGTAGESLRVPGVTRGVKSVRQTGGAELGHIKLAQENGPRRPASTGTDDDGNRSDRAKDQQNSEEQKENDECGNHQHERCSRERDLRADAQRQHLSAHKLERITRDVDVTLYTARYPGFRNRVENGVRIMVPPHIETGTRVVVNTAEASYVERARPATSSNAVARARRAVPHTVKIEVEIQSLDQLEIAIEAGADIVLLDNMSLEDLRRAGRSPAASARPPPSPPRASPACSAPATRAPRPGCSRRRGCR